MQVGVVDWLGPGRSKQGGEKWLNFEHIFNKNQGDLLTELWRMTLFWATLKMVMLVTEMGKAAGKAGGERVSR